MFEVMRCVESGPLTVVGYLLWNYVNINIIITKALNPREVLGD